MSNISEHDSEQKGEENNSEKSRIDLSVSGDSVGVDDQLERGCEIVCVEESGRREVRGHGRNKRNFRMLSLRFTLLKLSESLKH
jgi:hypothetical protein